MAKTFECFGQIHIFGPCTTIRRWVRGYRFRGRERTGYKLEPGDSASTEIGIRFLKKGTRFMLKQDRGAGFAPQCHHGAARRFLPFHGLRQPRNMCSGYGGQVQQESRILKAGAQENGRGLVDYPLACRALAVACRHGGLR